MAGFTLHRVFQGKFVVMDADDAQVFGPDTKAAATAFIQEREGAAPAAPSAAPEEEISDAERRRRIEEWDRKLTAQLRVPLSEEEAEIRAILAKRRKEDEVEFLMRQFLPMLAAGIEGGRRERVRFLRPLPKAEKAA